MSVPNKRIRIVIDLFRDLMESKGSLGSRLA